MNEDEQKRIFSKNLNYYITNSGKQQKEVAKALGISPTTFNTWCVGKIMPNIGKVQRIADYFGIGKSDLLDDNILERDPNTDFEIIFNSDIQIIAKKYLSLDTPRRDMLKNYLDFLCLQINNREVH